MPDSTRRDPPLNTTRIGDPPDLTPGAIYPRWIENRVAQNQIRGVAGEPLRLDAADWIDIGCGPICWRLPGSTFTERTIEWVPRSSGLIQIELRSGHEVRNLRALIGVRKADLVAKRDALDYYFCLVAVDGLKLHIVPLVGQNPGCEPRSSSKLVGEVAQNHPAYSEFMRAQTAIYRQKIVPRMFVDARSLVPGLYAVMSHDLVYLGGSAAVEAATSTVSCALAEAAKVGTGRGRLLRQIEEAVNRVSPLEYQYSARGEILFPRLTRQRLGTFSTEKFFYDIVTSLVAEVLRFGNRVGARVALAGATSVVTFNTRNGVLSTRVFDSQLGFFRQTTTGMDVFSIGRAGVDGFGNVASVFGALGGVFPLGGFGGPSTMAGTSDDGGGLPPIVGPISPGGTGSGGFAGDIEDHQIVGNENGKVYVVGDDGSIVGFDVGAFGPEPAGVGTDAEGDTVLFGSVTVIDFSDNNAGNDQQQQQDNNTDPNKPPDNQPPVDAGTPTGPTGDNPTATGTPKPDDGGGGGDPDAPRFGGGLPGSGGSAPPGAPSFGGVLPTGGQGGVVTRGGGYTDPGSGDDTGQGGGSGSGTTSGPSNSGGGGSYFASGGPTIIAGGGFTDPPSDLVGAGGFMFWGGYVAPIGGEADPNITGGAGLSGAPTTRTIMSRDGVHIEMFSGQAPAGFRTDGLFSAGLVDIGSRAGRGA